MKQHCEYDSTFYGNLTQANNLGGKNLDWENVTTKSPFGA